MIIKAVLIDFDGTLGNTNEIIFKSFQHTWRTFTGSEIDVEEVKSFFGEPFEVSVRRLFGEKNIREATDVYRAFQNSRVPELVNTFPGMKELVLRLKESGYKVALVTSRVRKSAYSFLKKFEIFECFDLIVTYNDIIRYKPDPQSIELCLEAFGLQPEEAVMIGDSSFDIECAGNAGCRSVLVDWSVLSPEERASLKPDFIAESADEIFEWILKQNGEMDNR